MSNQEVLALKYRPKTFGDLIGQEAVSRTLSLALENKKLSHAYLFSGLRGSGKTSSARIFAKSLLCEKGISAKPCEECDHCKQANEGRHIDIIEMDAASNRGIDDIRDLIEHTKYAPASGRFKIFIMDEVHMLTKEAFNALLKTLEEPPPYIKFLLATTDPAKLPATILSRTQHFRFKKITFGDVLAHLRHIVSLEQIAADEQALEVIARVGGGSLRDSITLLQQAISYGNGKVGLIETVQMLGVLDPKAIESYFDLIFKQDASGAVNFVREFETNDSEMVIDELLAYLKEQLFAMKPPFTTVTIERFFRIAAEMKSLLYYGADGSFVLALMSMKMIEALRAEAIRDEIDRLENDLIGVPNVPSAPAARSSAPQAQQTPSVAVSAAPVREAAAPRDPAWLYAELVRKVSDRSAQMGDALRDSVRFVAYENDELRCEFADSGGAIERLRKDYKLFAELVREVFGANTKIVKVSPDPAETKPDSNDPSQILEQPLVKQAMETFTPEKVNIYKSN